MVRAYLRHLWAARDEHALHSPFVFSFYQHVIKPDDPAADPLFGKIEELRRQLHHSSESLSVTDLGAGSRLGSPGRQQTVGRMARRSEKSARLARLLYRLVRFRRPEVIFDLGTSLGLTTLYQHRAAPAAQLLSFEGCPQTAAKARQHFDAFGFSEIELVIGNLDETLAAAVAAVEKLDFVFFDANHRYEPTVRYFETCLQKASEESIFVFDDIHWSAEMEQAWTHIQACSEVTLSLDLFSVGIVLFRNRQPKQHFVLRY